jgi:prepilin-type N-terminal cleavage/methylation domain-containing protein
VRHGVTLVELMVVILLLGLLSGVVGLTMGSNPHVASLDPIAVAVMQARDSALSTGHRVTISLRVDGRSRSATAFPDGRVLTDAPIEIDPLSGSAGRGTASSEHASTQPGAGDAEH